MISLGPSFWIFPHKIITNSLHCIYYTIGILSAIKRSCIFLFLISVNWEQHIKLFPLVLRIPVVCSLTTILFLYSPFAKRLKFTRTFHDAKNRYTNISRDLRDYLQFSVLFDFNGRNECRPFCSKPEAGSLNMTTVPRNLKQSQRALPCQEQAPLT